MQNGWIVLPRSKDAKHIAENIDIFDFELAAEDVAALTALHCGYKTDWDPSTIQ